MRTCLALTSAVGGALLAAIIAVPGASAEPTSPQCFQAQSNVAAQENVVQGATTTLSNDNLILQAAENKLAEDQAKVPVVPADIADDQNAVSTAQKSVNSDQASLRTAKANLATAVATRDSVCKTVTPTPTTTPVPPPVGVPAQFGNCAQAARFGYHDIPSTSPRYRLILDLDRDGIACETNGDDTRPPVTIVRPPAPGNTTIVNPPAQNTVINPAPAFSNPGPVIIVPPAPTPNIVTGNLPVTH